MQKSSDTFGESPDEVARLPVDSPDDLDLQGTAATPRITNYRANEGQISGERTIKNLVQWAVSME
jgi:hypothetical protein